MRRPKKEYELLMVERRGYYFGATVVAVARCLSVDPCLGFNLIPAVL